MNFSSVNRTVSLLGQLGTPTRSTVSPSDYRPQKPGFEPAVQQQPLRRVTPESQGVPSDVIRRFLRDLAADRTIAPHQVMILRNGKVLAQACYGAQEMHTWKHLFSASKSVTSLAVGILIGDGRLSYDTRVLSVLEKQAQPLSRLRLNDLTVEHLLTMTSGILFNEAEALTETDWVHGCLNSMMNGEPGKAFRYNSLNTYLLSAIVQSITGQNMADFLRERLFEPMGITQFHWETCPRGIARGGWGLYLCPEDFAKLAQLVMQNGTWNGQQLVPADYVERATTAHVQTPSEYGAFDYGYQFWCERKSNTFLINGMLGQNALGFRQNGILIVTTSGNCDLFQTNAFFALALRTFGGLFDTPQAESAYAFRALNRTISSFSRYRRCTVPSLLRGWALPHACAQLDDVTLVADEPHAASMGLLPLTLQVLENNYTAGLKKIRFFIQDDVFSMEYREADETHICPIGFGVPTVTQLTFHGEPFRVAVCGAFARDADGRHVLKLRLDFLETPCARFVRIVFRDGNYLLQQAETPDERMVIDNLPLLTHGLGVKSLLDSALAKLDHDYVTYLIRRLFRPQIRMKRMAEPNRSQSE